MDGNRAVWEFDLGDFDGLQIFWLKMNPNRFEKKKNWQLFENSNFRKFHFLKIQIFESYKFEKFQFEIYSINNFIHFKNFIQMEKFFHVQKCYSPRTPCWITSKRWSWVIGMPSSMMHLDLKIFVFWWFNKGSWERARGWGELRTSRCAIPCLIPLRHGCKINLPNSIMYDSDLWYWDVKIHENAPKLA